MAALFHPVNRARAGIKWGFVAHTVATFACLMINVAMFYYLQAFSYTEKRKYTNGPLYYQIFVADDAVSTVPTGASVVCGWLADGLLVSTALDSVATSV